MLSFRKKYYILRKTFFWRRIRLWRQQRLRLWVIAVLIKTNHAALGDNKCGRTAELIRVMLRQLCSKKESMNNSSYLGFTIHCKKKIHVSFSILLWTGGVLPCYKDLKKKKLCTLLLSTSFAKIAIQDLRAELQTKNEREIKSDLE